MNSCPNDIQKFIIFGLNNQFIKSDFHLPVSSICKSRFVQRCKLGAGAGEVDNSSQMGLLSGWKMPW